MKYIQIVVDKLVDSANWIKNKKAFKIVNSINKKDNKLFQYAVTVVLDHEKIKKDPKRIKKIKTFINKYKWEGKE